MNETTTDYQKIFENYIKNRKLPKQYKKLREESFKAFQKEGFPTRKNEEWHYTSLNELQKENLMIPCPLGRKPDISVLDDLYTKEDINIFFLNGVFSKEYSSDTANIEELDIFSYHNCERDNHPILKNIPYTIYSNPLDNLTAALANDGAIIKAKAGTRTKRNLHLINLCDADNYSPINFTRNFVMLEKNSSLNIIETYIGTENNTYFTNSITDIIVGENADLSHNIINRESYNGYHHDTERIVLKENARLNSFSFSVGAKLSRHNLIIEHDGKGSESQLNGLFAKKNNQLVDLYTEVNHNVPYCDSSQLYKGILNHTAKSVFNGMIQVKKGSHHISANQLNNNLLLSKKANANAKPKLLIQNDDVKCTHGATIGQLNSDELFYFKSRGISEELSVRMLSRGFLNDVLFTIKDSYLKTRLMAQLDKYFFNIG